MGLAYQRHVALLRLTHVLEDQLGLDEDDALVPPSALPSGNWIFIIPAD